MLRQPSTSGKSTGHSPTPDGKSRHLLYYPYMYLIIILGFVSLALSCHRIFTAPAGYQWMMLAAAAGITGFYCVKIPAANSKISIGDSLVFTNLILFGIPAGVLTQAIDSFSASLRARTRARRLQYLLFNVAATSLSAYISGIIFFSILRSRPLAQVPVKNIGELFVPLGILAIVHYLINSGSVSLIVALEKRKSAFTLWKDSFLWSSVTYFIGATAAGTVALTFRSIQPEIFIILLIVLMVVYFTYKTYLDKVAELQRLKVNLEEEVEQRTHELQTATERAILLADAAEAASRAKSDFLATMSHEIRTPLNAVIGYSEMLQEDALELGSPQLVPDLQKIRCAGGHLLSLINDVLDFSKIEAGMLRLNLVKFNFYQTVDDLIELFAGAARDKELLLSYTIHNLIPRQVIGDPDRLRQILTNLIGNAIKFTQQGSISVSVDIDQVDKVGEQILLRFEITDTGEGIPVESQSKIFHAFCQADNSITRRHGGTGLGLTIVKRLVEMMDGEVGVHSDVGKGSNFWFTARFRMMQDHVSAPHTCVENRQDPTHDPIRENQNIRSM
jgi:signal transduction histidine kinase